MEEVRQRGLQRALDDALRIASQNTAGFRISIDLDVVTPEDAPGVAVPAEGGLGGAELAQALEGIGGRPGLAAVELVEYCPRLDKGGRSAQVAFFFQAEDGIRSRDVTGVQTCALPISMSIGTHTYFRPGSYFVTIDIGDGTSHSIELHTTIVVEGASPWGFTVSPPTIVKNLTYN